MRQSVTKLVLFCVSLIMSLSAFAQSFTLNEGQQINLAEVMSQLPPEQAAELRMLFEATKDDANDKSYFSQIRKQMNALQAKEQVKAQQRGILLNSAIHLTPTKMAFHVIDGAIIFRTLMTQHNANPMAMVHHLERTFDPTAWISFYAFSVSQGYYIDFRSKNLSPKLKARAMTGLMYQGMVVGSLASNITADTITLFSDCVLSRLNNKPANEVDQKCDATMSQWTARKKANQYLSQLVNLLAGQFGSEFVEKLVKRGASSKFAKGLLKTSEKAALKTTNLALKMRKMELLIQLTPMGWEATGFKYLFTVAKFANFLIVDHIISPLFMRVGNNIMHRFTTANLISDIEKITTSLSINQWRMSELATSSENIAELPDKVLEMTDLFNDWRLNLNSDNEEQLELWAETNKQTAHQMKYARDFYSSFNDMLKGKYEDNRQNFYPDITLPLFGVKTQFDTNERKDINEYLIRPKQLTEAQKEKIKSVAQKYLNDKDFFNKGDTADNAFIKKILDNLASDDIKTQSRQIVEINKYLNKFIDSKERVTQYRPYGTKAEQFLKKLMSPDELGQPYPILDKMLAYSYAYSVNDTSALIDKSAKFPLNTSSMSLHNSSLLLMYSMLCGPSKTSITADEGKFSGFYLMFPSVVKNNQQLDICKVYTRTGTDYLIKHNSFVVSTNDLLNYKIGSQSIFEFITTPENLLPLYYDPKSETDKYVKWWNGVESSFIQQMDDLDKRKKFYIDGTYDSFVGTKTFAGWLADKISNPGIEDNTSKLNVSKIGSDYLPSNIRDSLLQELKIYSLILENIQTQSKLKYEVLDAGFIKNLRSNLSLTNDKQNLFPEISKAKLELNTLKKQLVSSNIITEDFVTQINSAIKEQDTFKNVDDYIKKHQNTYQEVFSAYNHANQYYTKLINEQPHLLKQIKESLILQNLAEELISLKKEGKLNAQTNPAFRFYQLISEFNLDKEYLSSLGFSDSRIYLKTLNSTDKIYLHTQTRLGYLKNIFRKKHSNDELVHKFILTMQANDKLKSLAFSLMKLEIFNLINLFTNTKVELNQIEDISKRIDMYGQITFGQVYTLEAQDYKNGAHELAPEIKLIYSLSNGIKSVVQNARRYASLRISTESVYKMSQNDAENVTNSMGSKANMSKNNGTHAKGSSD